MTDEHEEDHVATVSALHDGWMESMGARFVKVTRSEVIAELDVGPRHHQPLGMVHGGVLSGLVETVTSVGCGIDAMSRGKLSVGVENHTSFLHAVRRGRIRAIARAISRGSRTQVWQADVEDDRGRIVATGRVRFFVLEPGSSVAGEAVEIKDSGARS